MSNRRQKKNLISGTKRDSAHRRPQTSFDDGSDDPNTLPYQEQRHDFMHHPSKQYTDECIAKPHRDRDGINEISKIKQHQFGGGRELKRGKLASSPVKTSKAFAFKKARLSKHRKEKTHPIRSPIRSDTSENEHKSLKKSHAKASTHESNSREESTTKNRHTYSRNESKEKGPNLLAGIKTSRTTNPSVMDVLSHSSPTKTSHSPANKHGVCVKTVVENAMKKSKHGRSEGGTSHVKKKKERHEREERSSALSAKLQKSNVLPQNVFARHATYKSDKEIASSPLLSSSLSQASSSSSPANPFRMETRTQSRSRTHSDDDVRIQENLDDHSVFRDTQFGHISKGSMNRLKGEEFFDDSLLSYKLKKLSKKFNNEHDGGALLHVFPTHFFNKLEKDGFESVKRWTKRVDLTKMKYLVIPINEALHWKMFIVCNPFPKLSQTTVKVETPNIKKKDEEDEEEEDEELPCRRKNSDSVEEQDQAIVANDGVVDAKISPHPKAVRKRKKNGHVQTTSKLNESNEADDEMDEELKEEEIAVQNESQLPLSSSSSSSSTSATPHKTCLVETVKNACVDEEAIILIFDSIRSQPIPRDKAPQIVKNYLRAYFCANVLHKQTGDLSILRKKLDKHLQNMRSEVVKAPQQTNSFDCGVYLLAFLDNFLFPRNPSSRLSLMWQALENAKNWNVNPKQQRKNLIKEIQNEDQLSNSNRDHETGVETEGSCSSRKDDTKDDDDVIMVDPPNLLPMALQQTSPPQSRRRIKTVNTKDFSQKRSEGDLKRKNSVDDRGITLCSQEGLGEQTQPPTPSASPQSQEELSVSRSSDEEQEEKGEQQVEDDGDINIDDLNLSKRSKLTAASSVHIPSSIRVDLQALCDSMTSPQDSTDEEEDETV
eukprot:m.117059 g.117059  ORF g.117059 m.117059 type:complete len:885 (-) comp9317_c0_seq3:935-3589(-)